LLLVGAAHEAREAPSGRELVESDLTRALCAAFPAPALISTLEQDPGARQLVSELRTAIRRVTMARRFHNDAVRATRAVRRQRLVRYLRLAGRAAMPETFEMDDASPAAFGEVTAGL
jgi:hypothetical protein